MTILSILCEQHQEQMVPTEFKHVSALNSGNSYLGYSCSVPHCEVCFSNDHGYFRLDSKSGTITPASYSRRCATGKHDLQWMILTNVDGRVVWACPDPQCDFTMPE